MSLALEVLSIINGNHRVTNCKKKVLEVQLKKNPLLFVPPCQSTVVEWGEGINQKPEIGRVPLSESDCSFL